jgi:hypothetical protein
LREEKNLKGLLIKSKHASPPQTLGEAVYNALCWAAASTMQTTISFPHLPYTKWVRRQLNVNAPQGATLATHTQYTNQDTPLTPTRPTSTPDAATALARRHHQATNTINCSNRHIHRNNLATK